MQLPNVGGVALGVLQMVLYAIYRNCGARELATEGGMRTIVVVNPLGPAEVFPIAENDEVNDEQSQENNKVAEDHAQGKTVEAIDCPL